MSKPTYQPLSHTVTSASGFADVVKFQEHVLSALENRRRAGEHHTFVFKDVPFSWGTTVFENLDERISSRKTYDCKTKVLQIKIMPTDIHDSVQAWLHQQTIKWAINGDLTHDESRNLYSLVGTTIKFTEGPYRGSEKQPDYLLRPRGLTLPTLAVETGWSESMTQLQNDLNLLLVGGNGGIKIVLVIKWSRHAGGDVAGVIQLYMNNPDGMPIRKREIPIFPQPATPEPPLSIKRRHLFGSALLPGRNGDDDLELDVGLLRDIADDMLAVMGLVPA